MDVTLTGVIAFCGAGAEVQPVETTDRTRKKKKNSGKLAVHKKGCVQFLI
jgi:hypothetical protein